MSIYDGLVTWFHPRTSEGCLWSSRRWVSTGPWPCCPEEEWLLRLTCPWCIWISIKSDRKANRTNKIWPNRQGTYSFMLGEWPDDKGHPVSPTTNANLTWCGNSSLNDQPPWREWWVDTPLICSWTDFFHSTLALQDFLVLRWRS